MTDNDNLLILNAIFTFLIVLAGLVRPVYRNLSHIPKFIHIGFGVLFVWTILCFFKGVLQDFPIRNVIGDAYKLILMPLLFYFFYLNLKGREDFYLILSFLAKLIIFAGIALILMDIIGLVEARINFLLSFIPIVFLGLQGSRINSKTFLFAFVFLVCLTPLTMGVGVLITLAVFFTVILTRSNFKTATLIFFMISVVVAAVTHEYWVTIVDHRVLQKILLILSVEQSFIYRVEYVMAGRLTEFYSVIRGDNLILGNGFGSKFEPLLLDEKLLHWYEGLLSSNSHSMHSVFTELTLRAGIISFLIVSAYFIYLCLKVYRVKTLEGAVLFAISLTFLQLIVVGQPLADAFLLPMLLLGYVVKVYSKSIIGKRDVAAVTATP